MKSSNKFTKTMINSSVVAALGLLTFSASLSANDSNSIESSKTQVSIAKASKVTNRVNDDALEKTDFVAADKTATYSSSQTQENLQQEWLNKQLESGAKIVNGNLVSTKQRTKPSSDSNSEKSANHLYLYDASVYLQSDLDTDGYYSQIRVDFDVDAYDAAYYDVFAELYIREQGTSDWVHYYTTDVFQIYSDDSSDFYKVTTTFNDGFPPANYEIAIDLFEYGYSDVVDSLDGLSDGDLANLPIEDSTYELLAPASGVSVSTVKTEIFTDADGDGFYHDFKISFDADVDSGQRDVVAKLYQKTGSGSWQFEAESAVYTLDGTSTDDTIAFEGDWQSGYATSYYDFKIEIVDAATNEFLTEASDQFSPLIDVPLEDAGKDTQSGSGSGGGSGSTGGSSTTSHESGGGSWSFLGLALLAGIGFIRRKLVK